MKVILVLLFVFLTPVLSQFEVPDALVEVYRPRGLRVSIPDQEGIKLFAFHGKVNEEMNGREGGTFSKDILKPKNGRWTFYDATAQLKKGDILYYWTYVDYFDGKNKLGYANDDQVFEVMELLEKEPSNCRRTFTTSSSNQTVCAGQLIFSEEFSSLSKTIWTPEIKFATTPDYEFILYSDRQENLKIGEDGLEIRPLPSEEIFGEAFVRRELNLGPSCTGNSIDECHQTPFAFLILPPVTSSQISTKNHWSFKYGKVEIRAKLPKGDWIYPQLYLNPKTFTYGSENYASGQIRIAFLPGNNELSNILKGGCILGDTKEGRNSYMKSIMKNQGSWSDDFHKFTLTWSPDQISVSVDDQVYGNIKPQEGFEGNPKWRTGSKMAPFDQEMYISIGVGVGGHNFEDNNFKPWKNKESKAQKKFYQAQHKWRPTWGQDGALKVDYVKVYAL